MQHIYFSSVPYTVQVPGPAPNLQATATSPTSIAVSWETPVTGNGEIQNYKIIYTAKGQDGEQVRLPMDFL